MLSYCASTSDFETKPDKADLQTYQLASQDKQQCIHECDESKYFKNYYLGLKVEFAKQDQRVQKLR